MSQIRIVTDGTAEIPATWIKQLGITVVPVEVRFDDRTWRHGIDTVSAEFLTGVSPSRGLANAIPPSVEMFQKVYGTLASTTDQILSIHHSSKLGKTVENARRAADTFLGRSRIVVLDSELISFGLGVLVKAAAEAAAAGSSMQEVIRLLRGMIPHIYIVFFVESLAYLERSTRIDRSQAVLGSLLNLKPMLIIEDGELMPLEKVTTRGEAVERLHSFISEFTAFEQLLIAHGKSDEGCQELLERIIETFPQAEVSIETYGPAMVAQIGPEAIGVIIYEGL